MAPGSRQGSARETARRRRLELRARLREGGLPTQFSPPLELPKTQDFQCVGFANLMLANLSKYDEACRDVLMELFEEAHKSSGRRPAKVPASLARAEQIIGPGAESLLNFFQVRVRAETDAKRDLTTLGYPGSRAAIDGYLRRVGQPWPRGSSLAAMAEDFVRNAPPAFVARLPRPAIGEMPSGNRGSALTLTTGRLHAWQSDMLIIVKLRLTNEAALAARHEYFRLSDISRLPAVEVFRHELEGRLKTVIQGGEAVPVATLEALVGESAAGASQWMRNALFWRLEEADLLLEPRSSYLSKRSEPKQFGVWRVIDHRLRHHLGDGPSEHAKSRAIAAAFRVYAGPKLASSADPETYARNAIDKLRLRMGSDRLAEVEAQLVGESRVSMFELPDPRDLGWADF